MQRNRLQQREFRAKSNKLTYAPGNNKDRKRLQFVWGNQSNSNTSNRHSHTTRSIPIVSCTRDMDIWTFIQSAGTYKSIDCREIETASNEAFSINSRH